MKLRLPLLLIMALSLAGSVVYAAPVIRDEETLTAGETIKVDTIFTKDVHLHYSFDFNIGEVGGAAPVVEMLAVRPSYGIKLNVNNGTLKLGESSYKWTWANLKYSMWIGSDNRSDQSEGIVNVRKDAQILAESEILLGRWNERGVLNIYEGGLVKTKGISSICQPNPDINYRSYVNLLGGELSIGSSGISAYFNLDTPMPDTIFFVNLFSGTLSSYESWNTSRRNEAGNASGTERVLVLNLDSPGYVLPDGTISDGTGSLTIDTAADTTITLKSKIEGTGTGELIKSGPGTLYIRSLDEKLNKWVPNTFTQSLVLAGGTLQIDSDGAIGAGKTITVRNDHSAAETAFELTSYSGGLAGWRTSKLNFDILEGSELVFKAVPGGPANILELTDNKVDVQGNALFESPVVFDGYTEPAAGEYNFIIGAKGKTVAQDEFHISQNKTASIWGTLTVNKGKAADGKMQRGLGIGAYHATPSVTRMIIENGGLVEVKNSKVAISSGLATGHLIINVGGTADVWGIEDMGESAKITLNGGTLKTGAGGILLKDWSGQDDKSSKTGDQYLGNVYFSSGKLEITEDSFYRYTGKKEFAEIKENDVVRRPASVYTGHFFLGQDSTGALADAGSRRVIDVAEKATFKFEANILGEGGFNKTGKGAVVLLTANGYKGNTVVEQGSLYLGDDAALGTTGKLVLLSGSELAAQGKSVTIANNVEMGMDSDESCSVTLGKTGQSEILTLNGGIDLLASEVTLNVLSNTSFSGDISGKGNVLSKQGKGNLLLNKSMDGVPHVDIKEGKVVFGTENALSKVQMFTLGAGAGVDMGNFASTATVNFSGDGTLGGAFAYDGILTIASGKVTAHGNTNVRELVLASQGARFELSGEAFHAGRVEFLLGSSNVNTVLVSVSDATVTGTEEGSIDLIFEASYLNSLIQAEKTDVFQLFSTGLEYRYGALQYNQKQVITVTTDNLSSNGTISVAPIKTEADLIDRNQGGSLMKYTPKNALTYLGAKEGERVVVGTDVDYFLDREIPNKNYRLTPGLGTLVYQGLLSGMKDESGVPLTAETGLYILDYGVISKNADLHSTGAVVLTNNGNSYGNGTDVSSCMLTVDLSQGYADQVLVKNGNNVNVNVLGAGKVTVSRAIGSTYGGVVCLQAYGDATFEDVSSYTYANDFSLDGGSTLMQAGANSQILTGNIHSMSGNNVLSNVSEKNFVLRGNITQAEAGELTFYMEKSSGVITLDGSGSLVDKKERTLESGTLNISGNGTLNIVNGYTANVKTLIISEGSLSVGEGGVFIMGGGGMTGAGSFILKGGTLKSSSSWETEKVINLASGTTSTISTGGANVRLKKGLSGTGSFEKQGTGNLYVYDNPEAEFSGHMDVKQGRLVLLGEMAKARTAVANSSEYQLSGDLTLSSGKGASLEGMIDANNHKVTFGDKTHFYLSVSESEGLAGYIRNADTISIGSETQLHVDVLQDDWLTDTNYTIFSANNGIMGADNLDIVMENEFAFVNVGIDTSKANEVSLMLSSKGGSSGSIMSDGTNKGAIHAAVAPMVNGTLDGTGSLSGNLLRTMQTVSKMTTEEYDTYLVDMASSASSYYTALSAQVQDMTQHVNSVRNRVELMNPIMYDDWQNGGIYNMWVGGINHYRDVKSDFQSPGYKMDSWGGELGLAIPMSEHFMMGAGFAYTSTKTTVKDGWGENEGDTYNVDIFARYRQERWTLTGVLSGGFTNVDFHRTQLIKDQRTLSSSSSDGNQFVGTFEAMYDIYLNEEKSWILQPLVNVTAGRAKLDGLSETGELKNAGLALGSQSYNMFSAGVGAKIAYEYETEVSDHRGRIELRAMYVNDMGDTGFKVNGQFIGAPDSPFALAGVENESGAALVSVGWIAPISEYGQFFADASCEFRKNQNGVSSTIGFSFQF